MNYMTPQARTATTATPPTRHAAPRVYTDVQPRWPLFVSIFGAVAVSVLLWIGIIWGVSLAIAWVNGAG
ncbi:MAG: hypothetical protein AB7H66_13530 [Hyphomonadaceae bacterium]